MKVERLFINSRRVWIVKGDPLPPPERGTHWSTLGIRPPRDGGKVIVEMRARRWSEGLD